MFASYPQPPSYVQYDYRTAQSPRSAMPPSAYYTQRYSVFESTSPPKDPTKRHSRRTSQQTSSYSYAPPSAYAYYTPAAFSYTYPRSPSLPAESPSPPKRRVSLTERMRSKAAQYTENVRVKPQRRDSTSSRKKDHPTTYSSTHTVYVSDGEHDFYGYNYSPKSSPPPPYDTEPYEIRTSTADSHTHYKSTAKPSKQADPPSYKARERSTSYTIPLRKPSTSSSYTIPLWKPSTSSSYTIPLRKQSTSSSTKPKPRKQSSTSSAAQPPASREATPADAARARIPAGYSYKNWDPTEEPIYLLGSVFDANSLGKWIYDWTVFHHGPGSPLADLAGDLWLLLIQLAGKMKRAEEGFAGNKGGKRGGGGGGWSAADRELVRDFLDSAERLWARLEGILKACEEYMWRAAKRSGRKNAVVSMGANSGCEFVDSMFGRDRLLEETERLMQGVRLWNHRFDVNCEGILRA